jgi:hypothetical protein
VNKKWFLLSGLGVLFAFAGSVSAAKLETSQSVDAGSFGIYVSGKRIATETFSVNQGPGGSLAKSQMKAEDGGAQASELELGGAGELRHYEWHELSPGRAEATVSPNGEFLTEKLIPAPGEKPFEQPFLVGTTTSILDDFFFLHREILAWRYLASACTQEKGNFQCKGGKIQLGVLVPRQRASMLVSIQFVAREKVDIHGTMRELTKLSLSSEAGDWWIWLDDSLKLIRIVIPAENTEVLRD